jgi:DNA helicase HerA-like ATPase
MQPQQSIAHAELRGSEPPVPVENGAAVAHVIAVGSAKVVVRFSPTMSGGVQLTVGDLLGVRTRRSLVIGILSDVLADASANGPQGVTGQLDLVGEILTPQSGDPFFQRGVSTYPAIANPVVSVGEAELRLMFDAGGAGTIAVGRLRQAGSVAACIRVDDMLQRHFAVLGSTGSGKSSAISLILREVMRARPDLRILLIDPHDEYRRSFGDRAHIARPENFKLPFWLFNFDEMVPIIFGRNSPPAQEVAMLADLIPLAKNEYRRSRGGERTSYRGSDVEGTGYTVDTPVPYRIADLIALIESRMGKLENNAIAIHYQRLLARIQAARNNRRYAFIFDNEGDGLAEILSQLFRLQPDGRPMTVMQLAGFPAEVFDPLVAALFRIAFELGLHGDGAVPLLVVCEEAHNYAHADRTAGFYPAREALSRIAKEGRKHGVFLGLVTQRPAELDPTLLSQCSTVFAMRMGNESDQSIVRAAIADPSNRLLDFLTSLGTRDALAFGEGVPVAMQMRFDQLAPELVPRREKRDHAGPAAKADTSFAASVVARWRGGSAPGAPVAAAAAGYGLRAVAR